MLYNAIAGVLPKWFHDTCNYIKKKKNSRTDEKSASPARPKFNVYKKSEQKPS